MNNNTLIQYLENQSKELKKYPSLFYEIIYDCNVKLNQIRNDPLFTMDVNNFAVCTLNTFEERIKIIIDKLKLQNERIELIDLNEIHLKIKEGKFPLSFWLGKDIEYEKRKESFFQYVKHYVKLYEGMDLEEFKKSFSKVPHFFAIPIHRDWYSNSSDGFIIEFVCNHQGKINNNRKCKGRLCGYKLKYEFDFFGHSMKTEVKHDETDATLKGDHSHAMDMGFVRYYNSMLTNDNRKDIIEEIKKCGGEIAFREKYPDHGISENFSNDM